MYFLVLFAIYQFNFHTIKSILNLLQSLISSVANLYFHTIKSILNDILDIVENDIYISFPYY